MNYLFVYLHQKRLVKLKMIPMGIAYVAASLRKAGYPVFGINLAFEADPINALIKKIEDNNINVLCISELSVNYPILKNTITKIRCYNPNIKIIVGGGIITAEPDFIIENLDMDFGCIGYGEETICELANCIETDGDFSKVNGLIYKDSDGRVIITPPRVDIADIDKIPFPALDLFGLEETEVGQYLNIAGSRSCNYNCTFCFRQNGYRYKQRSLDNIFEEIDYWMQRNSIDFITFSDELFGYKKEQLEKFCERIKDYNVKFEVYLRVDIATEDIIKKLAEAGCFRIAYGIESADNSILKSMRKNITLEQIENALKLTRKYNIKIRGHLIFGDKEETYEIAQKTLQWWFKNIHYGIDLTLIRAYPGTEIYKHGVREGKIDRLEFLEKGCPPINLSKMSDNEYKKLGRQLELYNALQGEPSWGFKLEIDEYDKLIVSVNCPNCDITNKFTDLSFDEYIDLSNCKNCRSKININNHLLPIKQNAELFNHYDYSNKKIVVWGCTSNSMYDLYTYKKFKDSVIKVVDKAYLNIDTFVGFKVEDPNTLKETEFDVLYIGAPNWREEIIEQCSEFMSCDMEIMN